jgi:tryptophan synthase alpha chain
MTASLMTHMVAGYPDRERSREVARAFIDGGARYLEVQFPFSDPSLDGPVIQSACTRALDAGFRVKEGFELVREIRSLTDRPIFIMSYGNLVFVRGVDRFVKDARAAGAYGLIVPDLPFGHDEGLFDFGKSYGLEVAAVVSPSVSDARLRAICDATTGYIYASLRVGITGNVTSIDEESLSFLNRIGKYGKKIFAGFGVASHEQVSRIAPHVHAVVVGSALIRRIEEIGDGFIYTQLRAEVAKLAGS